MSVRAKFKVATNETQIDNETSRVVLRPVYDGSLENKDFFKYTPGGQIDLQIVNKSAAEQFVVGKEFYVDFTSADG